MDLYLLLMSLCEPHLFEEGTVPLNERKIIDIILEECQAVKNRCEGYQEEIIDVVTDIIHAERQHRIQGTNIQQQVSDKCRAAGQYLAEKRSESDESGERHNEAG